ncbi:MAP3K epsilon protein kinase 1-like isoform X2 [Apium graveolens]|uniref:MAP3K epsilon protein kinase 1-like isoform X2 n=1 Tax=Apium graveolens TaxID=4045 RepID=UPI003D7A206F
MCREMVRLAIDGIWKVLKLHRFPRNDFCRIAAKNGTLPRLTNTLYSLNESTWLALISSMNLRTRSGQLDPGNLTCGQSVPPPYGSDKHGVDDSLSSGTRDSSQASVFHSSNSRSFPLESDKPRSSTASIEGHDTRKLHDSSSFDKIIHGMMNEKSDPSRTAHRISIKRTQTLADGVSKCVDPLTVDISGSFICYNNP